MAPAAELEETPLEHAEQSFRALKPCSHFEWSGVLSLMKKSVNASELGYKLENPKGMKLVKST